MNSFANRVSRYHFFKPLAMPQKNYEDLNEASIKFSSDNAKYTGTVEKYLITYTFTTPHLTSINERTTW